MWSARPRTTDRTPASLRCKSSPRWRARVSPFRVSRPRLPAAWLLRSPASETSTDPPAVTGPARLVPALRCGREFPATLHRRPLPARSGFPQIHPAVPAAPGHRMTESIRFAHGWSPDAAPVAAALRPLPPDCSQTRGLCLQPQSHAAQSASRLPIRPGHYVPVPFRSRPRPRLRTRKPPIPPRVPLRCESLRSTPFHPAAAPAHRSEWISPCPFLRSAGSVRRRTPPPHCQ